MSVTAPDQNASQIDSNASQTNPDAAVLVLLQKQGHSLEELNKWLKPLEIGTVQLIPLEDPHSELIKTIKPKAEDAVSKLRAATKSMEAIRVLAERRGELLSKLSALMRPEQNVVPGATDAERKELEGQRAKLQAEIEGQASTMGTLATMEAALNNFAQAIEDLRSEVAQRIIIQRHNNAIVTLKSEFDFISEIPKGDDAGSPGRRLWQAYDAALNSIRKRDPATDIADAPRLSEFREDFRTAAQNLISAYESNAPLLNKTGSPLTDDADYWKKQQESIWDKPTIKRAQSIDALTSEAKQKKKAFDDAFKKMVNDFKATDPNSKLTAQGSISRTKDLMRLAGEAIEAQRNAPDAETAYQTRLREAEADIKCAAAFEDGIRKRSEELMQKAATTGTDFSLLKRELDQLLEDSDTVLKAESKKVKVQDVVDKASTYLMDYSKVDDARKLIHQTPNEVLSRLPAEDHRKIFDLLCANKLPKPQEGISAIEGVGKAMNLFDELPPTRVCLQQLMCATSLDPEFVRQDEITRGVMIESLKAHKGELQAARANWDVMSEPQKLELLKKVATAQADAFGTGLPENAIKFDKLPEGEAGGYTQVLLKSGGDGLNLSTDHDLMKDFETAMETIFHEMTHKHQHELVLRLQKGAKSPLTDQNDPVCKQARMFETAEIVNGTIPPQESKALYGPSVDSYKKQPKEAHAFMAGRKSVRMLLEMLST